MMIMRWCNVQTNEYDLQDKTYPIICIHHKLHNDNKNKLCNKHLGHTTTEKYDNNGKGGYFRFDDDNNMSYSSVVLICEYIVRL